MKVKINKDDIFVRKADSSGRFSLPAGEFAGRKLEIAVLGELSEEKSK